MRLALLALAAALVACSSSSKPTPGSQATVKVKGVVADCVFAGTDCAAPVATPPARDGRVIVFAVDADANVYQGSTLATGTFNFGVPAGKSYVILFRDSAARFLGTLIVNSAPAALPAQADLDLGTVKLNLATRQATSSNEAALAPLTAPGAIGAPADVVYSTSTTQVSFSLYNPIVSGMVVVSKGYGDAVPRSPGAEEPRLSRFTAEWDAGLQREVLVEWVYRCDGSDGTTCPTPRLNDKLFKYLTASEFCQSGQERSTGYVALSRCAPDLISIGAEWSSGSGATAISATVLRAEAAAVFPHLDGTARPGFILSIQEGSAPVRYNWFAQGVGEVLMLDADGLPTSAADLDHVKMRVQCVRKPDGVVWSTVGACPAWATDAFVEGLPTTF